MGKFGFNPYPKQFGGKERAWETELLAMLDALAPGWDADESTENYAELVAYGRAVAMIWAVDGRLSNSMIPKKMLETLPTWEQVLRVPPAKTDPVQTRRLRVAAKFLGYAGNALVNLIDVASTVAGPNFVEVRVPDESMVWIYWPGMNPGPPGFEWSSNRATICIVLRQGSLSIGDLRTLIENEIQAIAALGASWLNFVVGIVDPTTGEFIADVGVCDLTLLSA